ncbi:Short-chain dehydrogenase/reductase SDR [Metarhizium brunneum]
MASVAKTIVATGLSSGIGLEVLKQLLEQATPYKVILGARDIKTASDAVARLQYDKTANAVAVLPLELADLKTVKAFAQQALDSVGGGKIDYLLLNAGMFKPADKESPGKWCEAAVVNHFSQHYLTHLLREKLVASKARIVVVSSGAIRNVEDPAVLEARLANGSGADGYSVYAGSKFTQLLGAHWWRRQLKGQCDVVAVSPGLIPNTGLGRGSGFQIPPNLPDAKSVPEGAQSVIAALSRSDFPEDSDRIFLTSWGEWWDKDVIGKTLDKELQDKWCPGKEVLERDAGLVP